MPHPSFVNEDWTCDGSELGRKASGSRSLLCGTNRCGQYSPFLYKQLSNRTAQYIQLNVRHVDKGDLPIKTVEIFAN